MRQLGAEHVIDYTVQDFTHGAARYDLVLQLGGAYSPAAVRKVLTPHGTLIQSFGDGGRWFGPMGNIIKAVALNAIAGQTLRSFTAEVTGLALPEIGAFIESGDINISCRPGWSQPSKEFLIGWYAHRLDGRRHRRGRGLSEAGPIPCHPR